ncbi:hypothetical protein [Micromonospora chersina]|uniref:Uncharacterized protein n=1 Tax=Micromonospora chersina TaxID=47854 RepID=A0A1C6TXQ9_9ACTN|nr:hypothetical protein [Micromonospora chersina]SCL46401.1 hypothetical protein GA0070603_0155 [Micromonospora chersina]
MTGTPGEDGGSHAGETDGGGPEAGHGRNVEGGSVEGGRGRSVEGDRGGVPAPDRWKRWRGRARELWAATRRGAARLWTAARPLLDQLQWQEAESSPVTLVDRRAAPTLLVPAQGQVYHFVVRATFTWTSHNARPELFGWYVDQFQPQALQRFRRIAMRCASDIPPDLPRAFMAVLEGAMTGDDALPWAYERGEVTFTCEPDVSVYLDEPVRRLLQPYWDQRIALEWQRDLDRRRAAYAEEQRARRPENGTAPTTGSPENGATQAAGMPEALRTDHPPQQRKRPPEGRRVPRPDAPVEQFTPLEPFPPPPAPPPPRRPSGPQPTPQSGETPFGETPSGDPDSPGPPDA